MLDCGEDYYENDNYILKYLESLGATKLDYFIMSHAHSDHIESFYQLSQMIKIDKFIGMDLGINISTNLEDTENHPFYDKYKRDCKVPLIEVQNIDFNNDGQIDKDWKTDYYY